MNWISRKTILIVIGVIVGLIIILAALSGFFVDIFWYTSEGFADVFWTRIWAAVGFGLIIFALYVVVVGTSLILAWFFSRQKPHVVAEEAVMLPSFGEKLRKWGVWLFIAVGGAFAIINGISAGGEWQVFQRFLHATSFGLVDPVFGNDVSFYVFKLPLYRMLYDHLFGALLLSTVLIVVWYVFRRKIWIESWKLRTSTLVKGHVLAMVGGMFALKAWGYYLDKFDILFTDHGKFYGAGYADVNASLPMYNVLFWLTLAFGVAVLVMTWLKTNNLKMLLIIVASFIVLPLVMLYAVPWAVQTFEVNPNELQAEESYIGHNIEMTQAAYGLDRITPRAFGESGEVLEVSQDLDKPLDVLAERVQAGSIGGASFNPDEVEGAGVGPLLTRADIENNRPTIDNIRVWDWHYLRPVYNQIQSFKDYYEFGEDIDIDRYILNGRQTTVTISLRELNLNGLPPQADTWQNRHLVYTHGYGAVSNPVNLKSPSGQPVFYLQDIPMENRMEVEIDRPQIYFGEGNMDYSFAPASKPIEIDYPVGNTNQLTSYDASLGGGIPVGGFWRRLAIAIYLGSLDVFLSDYITPESRLLIRRNVLERVDEVAPYLYADTDPYPVLTNGGLLHRLQPLPLLPADAGQRWELHPQLGQGSGGHLHRPHGLLHRGRGPVGRDLVQGLPGHVQGFLRDARRHPGPPPLSQRPVRHPEPGLRHLPHERPAGLLQALGPLGDSGTQGRRALQRILHDHAPARGAQGGVHCGHPLRARGEDHHGGLDVRQMRPRCLRRPRALHLPPYGHHLRPRADRRPDKPESRVLQGAHPVGKRGVSGRSRANRHHPHRELAPLRGAGLYPGRGGSHPRAEVHPGGLWQPNRHVRHPGRGARQALRPGDSDRRGDGRHGGGRGD
jgi:hypothetical protein